MEPHHFNQLVIEVLDSLPEQFAVYLEHVEFIVEPRMSHSLRVRYGIHPSDIVYGFYEGVPITHRIGTAPYMPAVIRIFQDALERSYPHPDRLRKEVRRTVLHELAHHLGISDARLRELGAY